MQRAVAPFPAAVEPPEELEPPLPEDPPDDVPPEPLTAAAFAVTVTFTLTVFVAVTVGAGSGLAVSVAVAVAVVVTVGAGWALVAAVFVVGSSWPLPPAPTPTMKARPMAGSMYRLRPHFGLSGCGAGVAGGQCPGDGGWLYDMVPPRRFVVG